MCVLFNVSRPHCSTRVYVHVKYHAVFMYEVVYKEEKMVRVRNLGHLIGNDEENKNKHYYSKESLVIRMIYIKENELKLKVDQTKIIARGN